MSRKSSYSYEDKVKTCEDYLTGERSMMQIANDFGLNKPFVAMNRWIAVYKIHGAAGLIPKSKNSSYTKEFKKEIVEQYIYGLGSAESLDSKYNLNPTVLHR